MHLKKIKIDYSKAGTGEAPFDKKPFIGHGAIRGVVILTYSSWHQEWDACGISYPLDPEEISHWSPIPEFKESD